MNKKPTILFDVDGVVADFLTPTLKFVNNMLKTNYVADDIKQWNMFDSLKADGINVEEECFNYYAQDGFALKLHPYKKSLEPVRYINKIANLYFVTVPVKNSRTWCHDRVAWLKEHFGVDDEQVLFTHNKSLVRGDLFIDDRIKYVQTWGKVNEHKPAILWKQPYNKREKHDLIINDWEFVVKKIEKMNDVIIL